MTAAGTIIITVMFAAGLSFLALGIVLMVSSTDNPAARAGRRVRAWWRRNTFKKPPEPPGLS